jgi:hypothetical protein
MWSRQERSRRASLRTKRRLSGNQSNYLPALARSHPRRPPYHAGISSSAIHVYAVFQKGADEWQQPAQAAHQLLGRRRADKAAVDWRAWVSALTRSANDMSCLRFLDWASTCKRKVRAPPPDPRCSIAGPAPHITLILGVHNRVAHEAANHNRTHPRDRLLDLCAQTVIFSQVTNPKEK